MSSNIKKVIKYILDTVNIKPGRIRFYKKDIANLLKYGRNAPLYGERIIVNPNTIEYVIKPGLFGRSDSGRVISGDWDIKITSIFKSPKYRVCYERFVNNKTWEQSGAYELMNKLIIENPGSDGCLTIEDAIERYRNLDIAFEIIKKERKMRSKKELSPNSFRETGGIFIHIDRNGRPIFGGGGWHRLAIAKVLKLTEIPAQIGVVHREALAIWKKSFLKS